MICFRCRRPLLREQILLAGKPFGPKCAKRAKAADERQAELFAKVPRS
jgi:hypothetical protein